MTDRETGIGGTPHIAPWHVRTFGSVLKRLLGAGFPLGPNRLVTIPGRKSGQPRTTALAVIRIDGRQWVWAPWGDVQWVRNMRAAGHATIVQRHGTDDVRATELDATQRIAFFRDVLGPFARSIPFGYWFIRIVDGVDLGHPGEAAQRCPVFELHSAP